MFHTFARTLRGLALLLGCLLLSVAQGAQDESLDASRFLGSARRFADCVIQHGRDTYGKEHTPLFADGLHAETFEPVTWKYKEDNWVLSNFASQQPLVRLLDGLTGLTDEPKYREAAEAAARHALKHTRTPNDLLFWGGHLAWDLEGERGCDPQGKCHELKHHRPYYSLMWRVDPKGATRLMETIWAAHVLNWSRLDYNRHASSVKRLQPQWNHSFDEDIEVPFPSVGTNHSFLNTSVSLMHTGTMLAVLQKDESALKWTRRLAHRWQQARHPETGLCGARLSYRKPELDRAKQALAHVHPEICEAKIVLASFGRYRCYSLAQMQDAEALITAGVPYADLGHTFIHWASRDLKDYAKHCYDPETGRLIACLTDGTPIRCHESHVGYFKPSSFTPAKPSEHLLWAYAMAYRLTHDEAHWEMARNLAHDFGLGELGRPDGRQQAVDLKTGNADFCTIYALLELHRATGDTRLLRLAARIGDNIMKQQAPSGLFPGRRGFGRTGDERPLALLHLAAAIDGRREAIPPAAMDFRFFHARYDEDWKPGQKRKGRVYDSRLY